LSIRIIPPPEPYIFIPPPLAVPGASKFRAPMSALGQKQTSEHVRVMSALPPIADIGTQSWNVRFVP